MKLKYIVYVTVNLCNGKLYFGVHRTNPKVFDGYIGNGIYRQKDATLDIAFHRAVQKYGYNNFKRTTIAEFPNTKSGRELAYSLETLIVTPTLLRSNNVYNTVIGGISNSNDIQKRRIYQFGLNGNYLRSYKCARDAALYIDPNNLNTIRSGIKNCCLGKCYSYAGYYWSYFKEFIKKEDYSYEIKRRRNKIVQYDMYGKFLKVFNGIQDARNSTGISNIYYAIRNNASVGGFQWRWYTGDTNDIKPFKSIITLYRQFPIIMIDTLGNALSYDSIKQCVQNNPQLSSKGIKSVLNGKHKTHMGYIFKWKDEDIV